MHVTQHFETLVICPDLVKEDWIEPVASSQLDLHLEPSLIYWRGGGMFSGGLSTGKHRDNTYPERPGRVSFLEVLNQILDYLVRSGDYPNLRSIVIAGQSGGGTTVVRHATLGLYDPEEPPTPESRTTRTIVIPPSGSCIEVRYVAMSAGFLYLSDERFVPGSLERRDFHKPLMELLPELHLVDVEFEVPGRETLSWALRLAGMPVTPGAQQNG